MPLFSNIAVADHLKTHFDQMARRLHGMDDDEVRRTPQAVAELVAIGEVEPVTIQRSSATFEPANQGEGTVEVTMRVPASGTQSLFNSVPTHPLGVKVDGQYDERRWDDQRPHIAFMSTFPKGSSGDAIRAWGKEKVDLLELWIEAINGDIALHNGRLQPEAERLITERQRGIEEVDRLRGELGGGV